MRRRRPETGSRASPQRMVPVVLQRTKNKTKQTKMCVREMLIVCYGYFNLVKF